MSGESHNLLPIANIGRIMKQVLPPNAKISKETKERMQECASEFISFVTSEASDKCNKENRKTVNGDDICSALSSLGFDNYSEAMLRYLNKFRELERQKERAGQCCNNKASSSCSEEKDEAINSTSPWPSYDFGFLDKGGPSSSKTT